MIPIPAIDLKGGNVVRLLHGNFKEEKIYFDKPETVAKRFEQGGAQRIHVVDLDGALKGEPKNLRSIETILSQCRVPLEVGGGIRDIKTARHFIEMGVRWVILGTKACLDKGFLAEAIGELKGKCIIGIDARDGFVATDGWTKTTQTKAADLAQSVMDLGGKTIIYTDISKDGALQGPNLQELKKISQSVSTEVIASGGISRLGDLEAIQKLGCKNITGAIIGKALYEEKFTIEQAVKQCSQNA